MAVLRETPEDVYGSAVWVAKSDTPSLTGAAPRSVAVVHDYLNQFGGAERVVLKLAHLWDKTPIYTSLYRPHSTFPAFMDEDVYVSPVSRLPVDAGFRSLALLYPLAFRSFGTLTQELVISSSSGWAHGVMTSPETLHVVYCYTPARWLYRAQDYLGRSRETMLLTPLAGVLRHWDRTAARKADLYIAISEVVRHRIRSAYGFDPAVIHPPVDVQRFTPSERGERLLVISRLLPYKRVDLIIRAANRAGVGLDVVGIGPAFDDLRSIAGPTVRFHGHVDEPTVVGLLTECRALCVAGTEDFGLTPVEAMAAGKPVVAYAEGGALETVEEGVTGSFFHSLEPDALLTALSRVDRIETSPEQIAAHAGRFSIDAFRTRFMSLVLPALERHRAARV